MDQRECGSVRRSDFYEASTEHVTLDMRRTITKGDLHERFRSSAAELTLAELLARLWPTATEKDRIMMNHWARLRDASSVVSKGNFQGTSEDLRKIFDLLDVDGSQTLSMGELLRARILTKGESRKLLEDWHKAFSLQHDSNSGHDKETLNLSFNEFCCLTQKHLAEKYSRKEDEVPSWKRYCRSAFHTSKAATIMLNAAKDGHDLQALSQNEIAASLTQTVTPLEDLHNRTSSKHSLKTAAGGVKAAHLGFGLGRSDRQKQSIVMAC